MDLVWTLVLCGALALLAFMLYRGYPSNVIVVRALCRTLFRYVRHCGTPLRPNWTFKLELMQAVLRGMSDRFGAGSTSPDHVLEQREKSARAGDFFGGRACRTHGTEIAPVVVDGLEHLWLRAQTSTASTSTAGSTLPVSAAPRRFVVLYYHGGGYVLSCPRFYVSFCNRLREAVVKELEHTYEVEKPQVDFFLANYRKAPENKFPAAAEDAAAMYKYLLNDQGLSPRQIVLAGDSAGGGLALSALLRVRESQPDALPLGAVLHCAKTTMTRGSSDGAATPLCFLSPAIGEAFRTAYLETPDDPSSWLDASPMHCNLHGLPPVFVQTGSADYLHTDSLEIIEKVRADGITNWELDVHANMPHTFAVLPAFVLPYGDVAIANMGQFIARQFASTPSSRDEYLKH